mgnify:CR=1 FL=1
MARMAELEHEIAERKNASTKLIQSTEELDELKRKFNERIEEETKALKKEDVGSAFTRRDFLAMAAIGAPAAIIMSP